MRASLLVALVIGCTGSPARDAVWERRAATLAGHWAVRFDYAPGGGATAPGDGPATGSMELTVNRTMDREYPRVGIPTNYGTYAIAFRKLGGPPAGGIVPSLVAGVTDGDSMLVSFETDREGFSMEMRAPLASDSIRGTWLAAQFRGTIASGTFLMTRP